MELNTSLHVSTLFLLFDAKLSGLGLSVLTYMLSCSK